MHRDLLPPTHEGTHLLMRRSQVEDFEQMKEFIWSSDPLGLGDDREFAPDEYDDLAGKMVSARRRLTSDEAIDEVWLQGLRQMGLNTSADERLTFTAQFRSFQARFPAVGDR